ncbi:hypothetical protein [Streptomyces violascens]|uniref:hypothetical protein n=1 Tax=Streptomyces violascens TaxID=67381 RepID=UPI0036A57ED9
MATRNSLITRRRLALNAMAAGVTAVLALGSVTAATAAPTLSHQVMTAHSTPMAGKPSPKKSVTLTVVPLSVKSGGTVTVSGKTKGFKAGMKVLLQHRDKSKKWTTLHSSGKLSKNGSYKFTAKLNAKGTEQLRVEVGKTISKSVVVTLR